MNIIQHIKSRGMTVSAVARLADVSRQAIYDLAKPGHNPSMATVHRICGVVGIKPEDIRQEWAA
jgi:DNA-binding XRE family transcriptional regulator